MANSWSSQAVNQPDIDWDEGWLCDHFHRNGSCNTELGACLWVGPDFLSGGRVFVTQTSQVDITLYKTDVSAPILRTLQKYARQLVRSREQ